MEKEGGESGKEGGRKGHDWEHRFGSPLALVVGPVLTLTICLTLNKIFPLSVLQFLYCEVKKLIFHRICEYLVR